MRAVVTIAPSTWKRDEHLGDPQRVLRAADRALRERHQHEDPEPHDHRSGRRPRRAAGSPARPAGPGTRTAGARGASRAPAPRTRPAGASRRRPRAGPPTSRASRRRAARPARPRSPRAVRGPAAHRRDPRLRGPRSSAHASRASSTGEPHQRDDTRKCGATVYQASPVSTVIPPRTACATTPSGMAHASHSSRRLRGRTNTAAITHAPVTSTSAMPSRRFENSTHWCRAATSGSGVGHQAAGEALRPRRAAEPGAGHAHDRAGDRDPALPDHGEHREHAHEHRRRRPPCHVARHPAYDSL